MLHLMCEMTRRDKIKNDNIRERKIEGGRERGREGEREGERERELG